MQWLMHRHLKLQQHGHRDHGCRNDELVWQSRTSSSARSVYVQFSPNCPHLHLLLGQYNLEQLIISLLCSLSELCSMMRPLFPGVQPPLTSLIPPCLALNSASQWLSQLFRWVLCIKVLCDLGLFRFQTVFSKIHEQGFPYLPAYIDSDHPSVTMKREGLKKLNWHYKQLAIYS